MAEGGKKVLIGCGVAAGIFVGLIVLLLIVLGAGIESGFMPDSQALSRGKIPRPQLNELEEMGIVERGETVLFFYSGGLFSVEDDGNLFTDYRVISYQTFEDEREVYSATYPEIVELVFEENDEWAGDSTILVEKTDGTLFTLVVSNEGSKDSLFYKQLHQLWLEKSGRQ